LDLIDGFSGRAVAVAGDFVLDRFVHGFPKRVSREAPVVILRWAGEENVLGGGANTAANVASLSGAPLPAGAVGDDPEGRTLSSLFRAAGIEDSLLTVVASYATPTKTRILGGGVHSIRQQVVRIDREDGLPDSEELRTRLGRRVEEAARRAEVLVLADYGYGSCGPEWIARARAARPGIRILVDSRFRLAEYAGPDSATPNEEELERASGGSLGDSEERFLEAGRRLRSRLRSRSLLVTRGSRGMVLFEESERDTPIPVHGTDQVADVTGAGDTVTATFALAVAAGASDLEAALLANFAGGIVVMKRGTATVSPAELREAVEFDRAILVGAEDGFPLS
jgi:rfaE bifunctional protein kinase chain/domain